MENKNSNRKENEEQALAEWAPLLAAIPKDGEFTIPEDYLESHRNYVLRETIGRKKCIMAYLPVPPLPDEVCDSEKVHDGHGKTGELYVPHDYFAEMSMSINAKIIDPPANNYTNYINLFSNPKFIGWSVAASLLIGMWFFTSPVQGDCQTFTCLLKQTHWNNEDLIMLSEDDLESVLKLENKYFNNKNIESDTYINYLLESEIEIDELFNEFE